jgi:hypothetical protein
MNKLFLLILIILIIYFINPKLDVTENKDVLLWYNSFNKKRNYIHLFNLDEWI